MWGLWGLFRGKGGLSPLLGLTLFDFKRNVHWLPLPFNSSLNPPFNLQVQLLWKMSLSVDLRSQRFGESDHGQELRGSESLRSWGGKDGRIWKGEPKGPEVVFLLPLTYYCFVG